jgi:DNA polymerase III subunit epsilon
LREYLLFIDTEASGLPKKWRAPSPNDNNWPHSVQISWVVYRKDGTEIKYENHYVGDNDFRIRPSAIKIHGITREYLNKEGVGRGEILTKLTNDIKEYEPLLIAHFMEFDYHLLTADFIRSGIENPLPNAELFCTMLATKGYLSESKRPFLKLCDVYYMLFNETLNDQHNALVDARATAECFFELLKRGHINDDKIKEQNIFERIENVDKNVGCSAFVLIIVIVTVMIILVL